MKRLLIKLLRRFFKPKKQYPETEYDAFYDQDELAADITRIID